MLWRAYARVCTVDALHLNPGVRSAACPQHTHSASAGWARAVACLHGSTEAPPAPQWSIQAQRRGFFEPARWRLPLSCRVGAWTHQRLERTVVDGGHDEPRGGTCDAMHKMLAEGGVTRCTRCWRRFWEEGVRPVESAVPCALPAPPHRGSSCALRWCRHALEESIRFPTAGWLAPETSSLPRAVETNRLPARRLPLLADTNPALVVLRLLSPSSLSEDALRR